MFNVASFFLSNHEFHLFYLHNVPWKIVKKCNALCDINPEVLLTSLKRGKWMVMFNVPWQHNAP